MQSLTPSNLRFPDFEQFCYRAGSVESYCLKGSINERAITILTMVGFRPQTPYFFHKLYFLIINFKF